MGTYLYNCVVPHLPRTMQKQGLTGKNKGKFRKIKSFFNTGVTRYINYFNKQILLQYKFLTKENNKLISPTTDYYRHNT